jgi:nucleotide-binding universal stress UspA family protein
MSTTTTTPTITASQKITLSKMLVAIDGSGALMDAADYAISISERYNSELYALHVIRADVDLFGPMTAMRNEGEKYLSKVRFKANEKIFR